MPGFPQMAWPMLEWVLDTKYRHLFDRDRWAEASVIVYLPESTIAPLMEEINAKYKGLKAFSLPSMGEGGTRRHIELGVRGAPAEVEPAMDDIRRGVAGASAADAQIKSPAEAGLSFLLQPSQAALDASSGA